MKSKTMLITMLFGASLGIVTTGGMYAAHDLTPSNSTIG